MSPRDQRYGYNERPDPPARFVPGGTQPSRVTVPPKDKEREGGDLGEKTAGRIISEDGRFKIEPESALLTVTDEAGTDRVYLGDLGDNATDYGIEVYSAAGTLILGASGLGVDTVGSASIVDGAVTASKVNFTVVGTDNVVATINASAEGITIAASRLTIGAETTFLAGYDPSEKATASEVVTVIRATTAPSVRPSGDPLLLGDVWIDTDDGDAPYTYDGAAWQPSYTRIDGGSIVTGTIDAARISIGTSTTYATGYNPITRAEVIRATSSPSTRSDGSALRAGDMWIDTDDGDAPYTYSGSVWVRAYTRIDGGNIVTGTIDAARVTIGASTTYDSNYDPSTKETPSGAQSKADAAESAANTYTDNELAAGKAEVTVVIRSTTKPTTRPDGSALQLADVWVNTTGGFDLPYSYSTTVSDFIRMYTKIDGGYIQTGTIDASIVTVTNLSASNINTGTLDASVVAVTNLSATNITTGTLNASIVTITNLDASNITTGVLDAARITSVSLSAIQSNVTNLAAINANLGTITAGTIDASLVSVTNISASNINTGTLDAGLVTVTNLSANSITTGTLNGTFVSVVNLDATNITTGTLSADRIGASSITASKLAAIAIEAGKYIRSTTYTAGVVGWSIEADGTAEFNDVTIRGTLDSVDGTFGTITAGTLGVGVSITVGSHTSFDSGYDPSGKITTFYQTTAPTATVIGDLWIDVDDDNHPYRWDGVNWDSIRDAGAADTGGLSGTIYSATSPTTRSNGSALVQGDLWIETDAGNKPYIWNGSSWTEAYTSIDGGSIKTGSIQSTIYSAGSSGWSIGMDGSAEFNNVTVRGTMDFSSGAISSGSLTISADTERILMGSATAPLTGTGIFMGKDGTDYEFRVGDPSGDYIHFDGTKFSYPAAIQNPPRVYNCICQGHWNGSATEYTVTWSTSDTVGGENIAINYYRAGALVGSDGTLVNDGSTTKTISGGSSGDTVSAVVMLINSSAETESTQTTKAVPQTT